jgi:VCBS repeat-containing protein
MKVLQDTKALSNLRQQLEIYDDFEWFVTAHRWTSLASDSGASVAATAAAGGRLAVVTGGTDNNEACFFTTSEVFLLGADKPLFGEVALNYTEISGNSANVAFGFADAPGADFQVDDTGVITVANTGIVIYKVDAGTVWRCYSKNGATATDSVSTTTAGGSAQRLAIEVQAVDATNVEIMFYCNGAPLRDSNGRSIKHRMPYASATEMDFGVYAKAGSANSLTVNVDWIYAAQRR